MSTFQGTQTGAEINDAVATVKGAGEGICVKTGTGAGIRRAITGTGDNITITNGDGIAGAPNINWSAARIAQAHDKDEDTKLDEGGDNEVTAAQLKPLVTGKVQIADTLTGDAAILSASAGKYIPVNKATPVTATLNNGEFATGDRLFFLQLGVGKITVAVENGGEQSLLNTQIRSTGQGSMLEVVCIDGTAEDEEFFVIGGEVAE